MHKQAVKLQPGSWEEEAYEIVNKKCLAERLSLVKIVYLVLLFICLSSIYGSYKWIMRKEKVLAQVPVLTLTELEDHLYKGIKGERVRMFTGQNSLQHMKTTSFKVSTVLT